MRSACAAGADRLAATTANARAANESTLAEAKGTLAELEADGLTITARQDQLADRRRECESAEEALREIDRALGQLTGGRPRTCGRNPRTDCRRWKSRFKRRGRHTSKMKPPHAPYSCKGLTPTWPPRRSVSANWNTMRPSETLRLEAIEVEDHRG